jgi:RNA polymerase sigma-B factor
MRVPRDLKEALPKIRNAVDELSKDLGRAPETAEVAEEAGMEEDVVIDAIEAAEASRPASLDAPIAATEPDAATIADLVGEEDQNLDHAEWNVLLEERLENLDEREREVLYLRFAEDLTQREIGEQIGVSQMQVSRILSAALEQLRETA